MNISALQSQSHLQAADTPFDQLAKNPKFSETEKVSEAGRQFEAMLLRQILTEATKTAFKSTMNPESSSTGIYQDMITNNLADQMSRAGGIGLSRVLNQQLQHELKTDSKAEATPKV
ncbi:MAG: rod-binding protein [Verrucomicrobiota bacterium]